MEAEITESVIDRVNPEGGLTEDMRSGEASPEDTLAVTAGPGPLSSPFPPEGSDIWAMPEEEFKAMTKQAVAGKLQNMKGDL